MTIGIYLGSPKNTDKVYIGQSNNIEARIARHNSDMVRGVHTAKMQKAFDEYGEFDWEVLEECTEENLNDRETFYISIFNSTVDGFNTYKDALEAPPAYKGILNGNARTEDIPVYKKILDATISNPKYSIYKIAEIVGCPYYTVDHLWQGGYTWLKDIFPEEYVAVRNLSGTRQIGGKSLAQQGKELIEVLNPELVIYKIDNIRKFAKEHNIDAGDLTNVLNKKAGSVKKWIIKDLDISAPEVHAKFYSTNRGYYKKQFDLYKSSL